MQEAINEEVRTTTKIGYTECFNAANRRRTLIVIFAGSLEFFFGLSLLSSVNYFLPLLGTNASQSILFLIAGIVIGLIANAGSVWTLSHIGRRKLAITTLLITSGLWSIMDSSELSNIIFQLGSLEVSARLLCLSAASDAGLLHNAILGETSSIRLRSKSQAIGSLSGSFSSIVMNAALPYLYNPDAANLGAKTGFLFALLSVVAAILIYLFVPELKGRSVLEIDHLFAKSVSVIGSSSWRAMKFEEYRWATRSAEP